MFVRMLICQPVFLPKHLLSCPRDFNLKTCYDMREIESTFKSYVKKNFKYIPKYVSIQRILDPK